MLKTLLSVPSFSIFIVEGCIVGLCEVVFFESAEIFMCFFPIIFYTSYCSLFWEKIALIMQLYCLILWHIGLPRWLTCKESTCNAGDAEDVGLNLGLGRSPGGGHGNSLQYSCLENPMDRGGWQTTVHGVTKNWTQLKQLSTHAHIPT